MSKPNHIENVKTIYGTFNSWKGDLITEQLKQYSAHTRNELAMIKSLIKHGDNILDIGAHIGTFSIPFSQFNGESGKVFSFEANSNNFEILMSNIRENKLEEAITPYQALVSANDIGFTMSTPDSGNTGMHYFLPSTKPTTDVPVVNIDNWHKHYEHDTKINLIKIDVEGAEILVLRSCQQLLEKDKPILYIEINKSHLERFNCSIRDIEELLDPLGYHYFRNVGPRNSTNDTFKIAKLDSIHSGGAFFDLLAVHPSDARYPKKYLGKFLAWYYRKANRLTKKWKRYWQ